MLLTLVQQFAHLLDGERLVLSLERLLAFASIEKWAAAGKLADRRGLVALGRDPGARGRGRRGDHRVVILQLRAGRDVRHRIARPKMARGKLTGRESALFRKSLRHGLGWRIKTA